MFGLGKLFYVAILTTNGIAVLSEDRFLNRIGWSSPSPGSNSQYQSFSPGMDVGDNYSIKGKLINLIGAVRTLLRWPLILVNFIIILYELVWG